MSPQDLDVEAAGAAARRGTGPRRRALVAGVAAAALLVLGGLVTGLRGGAEVSGAGAGAAASPRPVTEYPPDRRGDPVQLAGRTLDGTAVDVADLRGRPVVVNVWGSWCSPCRKEAPVLSAMSRQLSGRVAFLGVNVRDNPVAAAAFESRYGIAYPSIDDRDSRGLAALGRYAPGAAVPFTLVLDGEGRVAARIIGVVTEATLRALLDRAGPGTTSP